MVIHLHPDTLPFPFLDAANLLHGCLSAYSTVIPALPNGETSKIKKDSCFRLLQVDSARRTLLEQAALQRHLRRTAVPMRPLTAGSLRHSWLERWIGS